jgi:REP element-mobilizing transposase RayT
MVHFASSPYEYRRRLPHFQKTGRPLFITFRKLGRDPLPAEARSIVLEHCVYPHDKTILLHSAVVMPEHVHLLLTPLNDDRGSIIPLHRVLKGIKGVSARRVNQLLATQGPLWQDESFDHVLRSDESFQAKVDYIRQNPVRRGLVSTPDAYPWLWPAP